MDLNGVLEEGKQSLAGESRNWSLSDMVSNGNSNGDCVRRCANGRRRRNQFGLAA